MTKEELKEQDIRLNKLCFDYQEKEKRIAELEKENAKQLEQIADLKNFCCEVSKYLHDYSMVRPNPTACKKRDTLLIKEFKLCEKWGDLK